MVSVDQKMKILDYILHAIITSVAQPFHFYKDPTTIPTKNLEKTNLKKKYSYTQRNLLCNIDFFANSPYKLMG